MSERADGEAGVKVPAGSSRADDELHSWASLATELRETLARIPTEKHRHDKRRSTERNERKRHSFRGEESGRDAHVDQRLKADGEADAGGKQGRGEQRRRARLAILRPRMQSPRNSAAQTSVPASPSSSPRIENTKSVWQSGRDPSFKPGFAESAAEKKKPPDPMASRDWINWEAPCPSRPTRDPGRRRKTLQAINWTVRTAIATRRQGRQDETDQMRPRNATQNHHRGEDAEHQHGACRGPVQSRSTRRRRPSTIRSGISPFLNSLSRLWRRSM